MILKNIAILNWVIGMILIILSNASFIIKPNELKRIGWKKYRRGYSIKENKSIIHKSNDKAKIKKLRRKIIYRRLYPIFLITAVVLLVLAN